MKKEIFKYIIFLFIFIFFFQIQIYAQYNIYFSSSFILAPISNITQLNPEFPVIEAGIKLSYIINNNFIIGIYCDGTFELIEMLTFYFSFFKNNDQISKFFILNYGIIIGIQFLDHIIKSDILLKIGNCLISSSTINEEIGCLSIKPEFLLKFKILKIFGFGLSISSTIIFLKNYENYINQNIIHYSSCGYFLYFEW